MFVRSSEVILFGPFCLCQQKFLIIFFQSFQSSLNHFRSYALYLNSKMKSFKKFPVVCLLILGMFFPTIIAIEDDVNNLEMLPEFDSINIIDYLSNERRLQLQFKCLVDDGPCDAVGHWLKREQLIILLINNKIIFTKN